MLQRQGSRTRLGTIPVGIAGFQCPNAYGKGCQNRFAGLRVPSDTSDGDGCNIFVLVHHILCLEACGKDHMLQLPRAVVIQIDNNLDGLHFLNGSSHEIHVVNRTKLDIGCIGIRSNKFHSACGGLRIYSNVLIDIAVVAHLITSGKLDGMLTVSKYNIRNRNNAVGVGSFILHTVDISFNGALVEAGKIALSSIFCNGCSNGYLIYSNSLTVQRSCIGHTFGSIGNIRENGSFTVINSRRIVYRNIIHVKDKFAGDITVLGCDVIIVRSVTVGNVKLHHGTVGYPSHSRIRRRINIQVVPTGLIERRYDTGTAGRGVHRIAGNRATQNGGAVVIITGYSLEGPTGPQAHALVGNIEPYANAHCVFKNLRFRRINAGLHITRFQRVRIVHGHFQCMIAAVHFTGRCINNRMCTFRPYIVIFCAGCFRENYILIGTVFEVIYHFRGLAELDGRGCAYRLRKRKLRRQRTFGGGNTFCTGCK